MEDLSLMEYATRALDTMEIEALAGMGMLRNQCVFMWLGCIVDN